MVKHESQPIGEGIESKDIALFDRIAETYNRKDQKPASRRARRQRLRHSLARARVPADARMLELGCGAGWSVDYLAGRYGSYVGLDYSEKLIDYARAFNTRPAVEFRLDNIKSAAFDEPFDLVFAIGVLHHMDDIEAGVRRAAAHLKPGGWLVANEPQPGNPVLEAARFVRKRVDPKYSDDQVTLGVAELTDIFERSGLTEVAVYPQGYFSTVFAEVVFPCQPVSSVFSWLACRIDAGLERVLPSRPALSWNLIAVGRLPHNAPTPDEQSSNG